MDAHMPYDAAVRDGTNDRGFTMVEVAIAIVVLLVGVISIVGISAHVSRANTTSNVLNVLATAAQDQVDTLRAARWSRLIEDPRLAVGGSLTSNQTSHFLTEDTPVGTLVVRWVVQNGPGTSGDVRTVTLNVVQTQPMRGLENGFTVTTIITRS